MTPEQEIRELKKIIADMRSGRDLAFLETLKRHASNTGTSAKTAASATQSVNEAGTSSYDVMVAPSGFIQVDGKNVPFI